MGEHPILFSAPMVRALLDGTKTQTRRVLSRRNCLVDGHSPWSNVDAPGAWPNLDFTRAWVDPGPSPAGNAGPYLKAPDPRHDSSHRIYSRIQVGDRLWVRETWAQNENQVSDTHMDTSVVYRADGDERALDNGCEKPWRPSIFMPRWASRITLEVTEVRVQRLQQISEDDSRAEGITEPKPIMGTAGYVAAFSYLWDSINGKKWPWTDSNPWVRAFTFKRVA